MMREQCLPIRKMEAEIIWRVAVVQTQTKHFPAPPEAFLDPELGILPRVFASPFTGLCFAVDKL